jgi:hypothetical protein
MKKHLIYFVALIILSALPAAAVDTNDWGTATNNLQMSISLKGDKKKIKINQPVKLLIRYRNVSTNEHFWFYEVNGGAAYDPNSLLSRLKSQ